MQIKVKKLNQYATIPSYQTVGASGMDLHYCGADFVLEHGYRHAFDTGLAFAIPPGFEGQVRPRSGLALKQGLTVLNSPGTIDSDYTGPVKVILYNSGPDVTIKNNDRIAQIVFAPVAKAELEEVDVLDATFRGAGGFGSTGV